MTNGCKNEAADQKYRAAQVGIDIEKAFLKTMEELDVRLDGEIDES